MYKDEILDLYKNPRNVGELETEYHEEGENSSCGDSTEIFLDIKEGKIVDVKHRTEGCAISTASVSILTDEIKGMEVEELKRLDRDWMLDKLGIEVSALRVKCAVLGLKTAQKSLED
ncbi:MAG: FeS assembly protein SufA [Nanohaloarchaea archaeon SW_4_43_9]|nr:MAG: FeS assembly protein SufA [Nanohaloarchaea archaeon SW_4_43_9]